MDLKCKLVSATLAFALLAPASAALAAGGDAKAGKVVFAQCMACHKLDTTGKSTIGPNLNKVAGRTSGTLPGFKYSPAMVAAKRTWTDAALDAYLTAPMKAIPGNRMAFAGVKNAADRKNLIAYIKSASK